MGALLNALAGGHIQMFQGGSSSELLYSNELAVMEDDVAGWIGGALEGPVFSDETLAIDLINDVGPIPGHYMATAHTRKWWNQEDYFPQVADTESYASWTQTGKRDMLDRAREKVAEILETHTPTPLTDAQHEAVEDVLKEARDYYRGKGVISDAEWSAYKEELSLGDGR
jgi:trimethylamine--corrinoid protein Co-methyltransferase